MQKQLATRKHRAPTAINTAAVTESGLAAEAERLGGGDRGTDWAGLRWTGTSARFRGYTSKKARKESLVIFEVVVKTEGTKILYGMVNVRDATQLSLDAHQLLPLKGFCIRRPAEKLGQAVQCIPTVSLFDKQPTVALALHLTHGIFVEDCVKHVGGHYSGPQI